MKRVIKNKLNDLSGKDWIKFTKSWFIHKPKRRDDKKILHPAPFPESLVEEFILFFTKSGEMVLDPFLGTGSTLLACINTDRDGIGFEIMKKYADISKNRINNILAQMRGKEQLTGKKIPYIKVISGNSKELSDIWKRENLREVDYCITSPPYWNQLKRNNIRQKDRVKNGLDTIYGDDPNEIGNIDDYDKFLLEQKKIFDEVYKVMKNKGYLTIITNNVFFDGRMYPLAFDTVRVLSQEPCAWIPKDEKIWLQDDKSLLPLGIYNAWVGNRHHQYCLIFRKEK